ncbi:hypothetical protein [Mycobacteroides abscessus]|uniref:hypothetical protein n=1 Tax=Mycobacteroides abscessus TaxID=36809 RepID=UPI0018967859
MAQQITTTIRAVQRGTNTANGNPQYTVTTDDGVFKTEPDGSVAFGISNSEYLGEVKLILSEKNRIVGVSTPDGSSTVGLKA